MRREEALVRELVDVAALRQEQRDERRCEQAGEAEGQQRAAQQHQHLFYNKEEKQILNGVLPVGVQ